MKYFIQNKEIILASERLKVSALELTYFLNTLIKVNKGDFTVYNLNCCHIDKNFRNLSEKVLQNISESLVPPSRFLCLVWVTGLHKLGWCLP